MKFHNKLRVDVFDMFSEQLSHIFSMLLNQTHFFHFTASLSLFALSGSMSVCGPTITMSSRNAYTHKQRKLYGKRDTAHGNKGSHHHKQCYPSTSGYQLLEKQGGCGHTGLIGPHRPTKNIQANPRHHCSQGSAADPGC